MTSMYSKLLDLIVRAMFIDTYLLEVVN